MDSAAPPPRRSPLLEFVHAAQPRLLNVIKVYHVILVFGAFYIEKDCCLPKDAMWELHVVLEVKLVSMRLVQSHALGLGLGLGLRLVQSHALGLG